MSRPSAREIDRLASVAYWISETLDEHGYLVSEATSLHKAFTSTRRPSSALARELVLTGARKGASIAGIYPEDEAGGLDLISIDESTRRKYRIKRAAKSAEGRYELICGPGSTLLHNEPDSLLIEERWALGYLMNEEYLVEEIFAAQVIGSWGEGPVHLILSDPISLLGGTPPSGFTSTDDDDLPGFEDDENEADGTTG